MARIPAALAALIVMSAICAAALPTAAGAATDNRSHLYTLDGFGGVHPVNGSPALSDPDYFGWDIARGFAIFADGTGGYMLDGKGGVHPVGNAPRPATVTTFGTDVARAIALAPWASAATPQGWVLDGFGGVHPFGGAAAPSGLPSWNWDIARALVIAPDSTPASVRGWILDGFGGLHPFGGAAAVTGPYFGFDIARGLALSPGASSTAPGGYVLDGYGGINHVGGAPAASVYGAPYWPGWDIAHGIVGWTGGYGGWVVDGYGGMHPFGNAPAVSGVAYWAGWDIARGTAGAGSGTGYRPPQAGRQSGSAMLDYINQDRAAAGLAPLQWSSCLATVAKANSDRMAAAGAISHTDGVYQDLNCALGGQSGENVGYISDGADDSGMNQMYMNSPEHRANILGPYHYVATAWTIGPNGYGYSAEEFS